MIDSEILVHGLLFFIGASLMLYVILGGADYGAGILELLPAGKFRNEQKEVVNSAMGPVWEANHMWLIILVVILFMGFPSIFTTLMTSLHLPMVALLIGIVIRGSVFTFRHYDAIQEPKTQRIYTWAFGLSSLWTSLWLGIIAGSLYRGLINPEARDFVSAYITPWWGVFPLAMGFFVVAIFSFLASIYLVGETHDRDLQSLFKRRAFVSNCLVVLTGALVFAASKWEGGDLLEEFVTHPFTLFCMLAATALFALLWLVIRTRSSNLWLRVVAAGQCALILSGWFMLHAPDALTTPLGEFSFYEHAAPDPTLWQLNLALLVGSLLIFPSLFFLLRVFKMKS